MKNLLISTIVVLLVLVVVGGMTGLVPGLSSLFGTDKPKDLGVKISLEDSVKAQEKSGVQLIELPQDTPIEKSFVLSGQRNASFTYDSKEATAIINNRPWKYYPFSNLQLRINSDGSLETSGTVDMNKLFDYAASLGYSTEDVKKAMDEYHIPKINMPFYVKGVGSVIDNKVSIDVHSLQAGKIPVPSSILSSNQGRINSFAQDCIGRLPGFSAKKLVVENNQIVFDGTMPEKESIVVNK